MAYISKIQMPDGRSFEIKDAEARSLLSILFNGEIIINCGTAEEHIPKEEDTN